MRANSFTDILTRKHFYGHSHAQASSWTFSRASIFYGNPHAQTLLWTFFRLSISSTLLRAKTFMDTLARAHFYRHSHAQRLSRTFLRERKHFHGHSRTHARASTRAKLVYRRRFRERLRHVTANSLLSEVRGNPSQQFRG